MGDVLRTVVAVLYLVMGVLLLWIAFGNIQSLLPPHFACGYQGNPALHIGNNYAIIYSGRCGPYANAWVAFLLFTVIGVYFTTRGIVSGYRYRFMERNNAHTDV